MGFDEFAFSLRMRDTIEKMIQVGVDRLRPKYRYATVDSIDRVNYKCTVTFNGETNPVEVSMGSIQPSAVGQVVRIDGLGTDKFISDVIGVPYFNQSSLLSALAINKGGTGATTAADARTNLAATYAGHLGNLADLDDFDQYPLGFSVGYFSSATTGRPTGYGTVITNKAVATRSFQICYGAQVDECYMRYYYNAWGSWRKVSLAGLDGLPYRMAAGTGSFVLSSSAFASTSVTFPVGRFTAAPIVTLAQTSLPAGAGLLIPKLTGRSTSGFTAYVYNGPGTAVTTTCSFNWMALQMTDSDGTG